MTTLQLNAEILRNLGALAEDESMLKRVWLSTCVNSWQRKKTTPLSCPRRISSR